MSSDTGPAITLRAHPQRFCPLLPRLNCAIGSVRTLRPLLLYLRTYSIPLTHSLQSSVISEKLLLRCSLFGTPKLRRHVDLMLELWVSLEAFSYTGQETGTGNTHNLYCTYGRCHNEPRGICFQLFNNLGLECRLYSFDSNRQAISVSGLLEPD